MSRNFGFVPAAAALLVLLAPLAVADGTSPPHLGFASVMNDDLRNQTLAGQTVNGQGQTLNDSVGDRLMRWKSDGWQYAENRTLCNQHVVILYKRAWNWSDAQWFAKTGGHNWPSSETFYNLIASGTGFTRVQNPWDIQAGDLMAVSYKDDPNSGYPSTTGHCAFINTIGPRITYTFPNNGLTVHWRDIEVFDSSTATHSQDSRTFLAGQLGAGSPLTSWKGAGRGWMRIYVDAGDNYVGYTWSMTGVKTQGPGTPPSWSYYSGNYKPESLRHWIVGRIIP